MKSERNAFIEYLRYFFTINVLLFHGIYHRPNYSIHTPVYCLGDFSVFPFGNGWVGVEFFALSVFFSINKAKKYDSYEVVEPTYSILKKYIKRLFPLMIFCTMINSIYHIYELNGNIIKYIVKLIDAIPNIFFLEIVVEPPQTVVYYTWYISVLFISIAVLFPVLLRYKRFSCIICSIFGIFMLGSLDKTYSL